MQFDFVAMQVEIYGNSHFLKTVASVNVPLWSTQRKWCYCGRVKQPKPVGLKLVRDFWYDVMKHSDTCRSRAKLQDGVLGTLGSPHWSAKASLLARACPGVGTRSRAARITGTNWTLDCEEMEPDPGAGTGSSGRWAGTVRAGGALRAGKHPKTLQLLRPGSVSQKVHKRVLPALAETKALGTLTCQSENHNSRVTGNWAGSPSLLKLQPQQNKQFSIWGSILRIKCSLLYKARFTAALLLPSLSKEVWQVKGTESSREPVQGQFRDLEHFIWSPWSNT